MDDPGERFINESVQNTMDDGSHYVPCRLRRFEAHTCARERISAVRDTQVAVIVLVEGSGTLPRDTLTIQSLLVLDLGMWILGTGNWEQGGVSYDWRAVAVAGHVWGDEGAAGQVIPGLAVAF